MTDTSARAKRHRADSSHKRKKRAGRKPALELAALQEFRCIFGSARRHDAEVRRIAGISGSQLWALSEISRAPGMRVNDLAEKMALHQTTASNLVNALIERKLIRRERDSEDQRVVRLSIATEGKKMLLRAPGPYAGLLVDALRQLKTPEVARLSKALRMITRALRDGAAEAAGQTLMGE